MAWQHRLSIPLPTDTGDAILEKESERSGAERVTGSRCHLLRLVRRL
jgi:hypothetical protein